MLSCVDLAVLGPQDVIQVIIVGCGLGLALDVRAGCLLGGFGLLLGFIDLL